MPMQMESEVAMKQWLARMKAGHLWNSFGSPGFWKVLDGKSDLRHCILKTQAPW